MNRDHRRIIHDLAQVYGLESVSYDSEPKRNVVVTAVRWVDLAIIGRTAGQCSWTREAESVDIRFPFFLHCKNSWKIGFWDGHSEMIERSTPDCTSSRLPRFTSVMGGSIPEAEQALRAWVGCLPTTPVPFALLSCHDGNRKNTGL